MPRKTLICLIAIFAGLQASALHDSLSPLQQRKRKLVLTASTALFTSASLAYLNQAWYSDYKTSRFHYFNDNSEWLQMDKAGHVFSCYQAGRLMMQATRWTGSHSKKSLLLAGSSGLIYMSAIEILDGFSEGWGFSWGDQAANAVGAALAITQQMIWSEQKILLKYAYAPSGLAAYNPSLLGNTLSTRLLKDYNAQTYWLSFNPMAFSKKKSRTPWLNLALGYGAYGMIGGHSNNFVVEDPAGNVLGFERQRRFYLGLDIDFSKIKTRSRALRSLFSVLNILKFPSPCIGLGKNGLDLRFL